MQISVEHTGKFECRMTVTLPTENVDKKISERLEKIQKNARIDGFRPGKVPLRVLKSHYGQSVKEEVFSDMVNTSFYDALHQENLSPVTSPKFDADDLEKDGKLEYSVSFDVLPPITLADFSTAEIQRISAEVMDTDIEEMLEKLRKQNKTYVPVKRAAQIGDRLLIDFVGKIGDEPFDGGSAEDFSLELGEGKLLADFENALVNAETDQKLDFPVSFPEDYGVEDLKGKEATFFVTVHEVEEVSLPALDDEFAVEMGSENLQTLRDELKNNMTRELKRKVKDKNKQAAFDALVKLNPLELPEGMIEEETKRMQEEMFKNLSQGRNNVKLDFLPAEIFRKPATNRLLTGVLLSEVIKLENLNPDDDKIREMIEEIAGAYQHPQEVVDWYYQDKTRLSEIKNLALEDMTVDFLLGKAKVLEKHLSYQEAMAESSNEPSEAEENSVQQDAKGSE